MVNANIFIKSVNEAHCLWISMLKEVLKII